MRLPCALSRIRAGFCLLLLTAPGGLLLAQNADPISAGNDLTEQLRADLNQKLNQPVEARFDDVSLRDAVTALADQIQADIVFDATVIEEQGLTTDVPVSLAINHARLPARHVLELLLRSQGLAAINDEGILLVTTETKAEDTFYIRVYDVRDLIDEAAKSIELRPLPECECPEAREDVAPNEEAESEDQTSRSTSSDTVFRAMFGMGGHQQWSLSDCLWRFGGQREMAATWLMGSIQAQGTGPWFNMEGVGGEIGIFNGRLVITQSDENHAKIQKILEGLRAKEDARDEEKKEELEPPADPPAPETARFSDPELRIDGQEAIEKEVVLQAGETYPIEGQFRPENGKETMLVIQLLADHDGKSIIMQSAIADATLTPDGLLKFEIPFEMPNNSGRFELRVEAAATPSSEEYVVMSEAIRLKEAPKEATN